MGPTPKIGHIDATPIAYLEGAPLFEYRDVTIFGLLLTEDKSEGISIAIGSPFRSELDHKSCHAPAIPPLYAVGLALLGSMEALHFTARSLPLSDIVSGDQ